MKRLIVLLGVVGISTSAIWVRWSTAPSLVLVLYRMSLAALLLLPAVVRNREELKKLTRRDWLMTMAAGCCLGLHFASFFEGVRNTTIVASSLLSDTEVLFVAAGSILFLGRKFSRRSWVALFIALVGAIMVALAGSSDGTPTLWGNALSLLSALLLGMYTMIGSECRQRVSNATYTFVAYCVAAATVLVVAVGSGTPLGGYGAVNWLTALAMAVVCTLLGHSIFTWGLKYLSPAYISMVKLLDPLFAAIWGLFFHEMPTALVLVGGVIVVAGVALYGRATEESA